MSLYEEKTKTENKFFVFSAKKEDLFIYSVEQSQSRHLY